MSGSTRQQEADTAPLEAVEANRRLFAELAESYDRDERCASDRAERAKLRAALESALAALGSKPRVLDAGGGTGNAGSILLEHGTNPLVLDLSPEMLSVWEGKAEAVGHEPQTEVGEVHEFLRCDEREWDLIVFSSVLHHLEHPDQVLAAAARRLAPGGMIVTIFDPTPSGPLGQTLRRIDWVIWGFLHYPRRMPAMVVNRVNRGFGVNDPELSIGRMAERHAHTGLDDFALADTARAAGLDVVNQRRGYDARYGVIRLAFRVARHPTSFSLVLRRRHDSPG